MKDLPWRARPHTAMTPTGPRTCTTHRNTFGFRKYQLLHAQCTNAVLPAASLRLLLGTEGRKLNSGKAGTTSLRASVRT